MPRGICFLGLGARFNQILAVCLVRAHHDLSTDLLLNLVLLLSGSTAGAFFAQLDALGAQRYNARLVGVELLALLRCGLKQGQVGFLTALGVKRLA